MHDADVIVVGGGPAGSSAAFALARQGLDVLLLDRARFPRDKVCSEYLSPQASRVLSEMGVLDEVESAGPAHLAGMAIRAPDGTLVRGDFASNHGFAGFRNEGIAIRRVLLDAILLAAARREGVRVRESCKVTDVTRDSGGRVSGVTVRDADGERSLASKFVIGADGLRSVVGRRLGLIRTSRWPKRIAVVAHYRGVRDIGDVGEMHVDRGGYLGLVDVGGGVTNVAVVVPMSRGRDISANRAEFIEQWIAARPQLAPRFSGAVRIDEARATGPFASSTRRASAPGCALVGDAAEFYDPFTGEGIYTALRGGEIVARYVGDAVRHGVAGESSALAAYEKARRAEFSGKWKVERLLGMVLAVPALMNRIGKVLSVRKDMTDLLVGVAGDFVPAREVLNARFLFRLLVAPAGLQ